MKIVGQWHPCSDGVVRPTVMAAVVAITGQSVDVRFLVDIGADCCTVLSADTLNTLQLPIQPISAGVAYRGVGGPTPVVVVNTVLEFKLATGSSAHFRGQFSAFTDPTAADMSILGRDVLNQLDVIVSRPRNEVLLLAPNHRYVVLPP